MSEGCGFASPDTYDPGRWAASELAGLADYENRDHYGYGSGRRICPGMHLAERTMWRMTAKLLWAYDIVPAVDAAGNEVPIDVDAYEDGIINQPKPYAVQFRARSAAHEETVRREAAAAMEFLARYE
ncbi:hypothetical protein SLS56_007175 [Neofusicoccum ribis]|uniref:Cytochrome P450 n=1 Tax=Neofusicoccum ribis TaxID=45134 RepID=A0ABR3SP79_9PEZI